MEQTLSPACTPVQRPPIHQPWLAVTCVWLGILLLGWCLTAAAALQAFPADPQPVTDLTASLSARQQQDLTRQLLALERKKGSQLAVLIVPTTGEESIEQFSMRVVEQWKLGREGVDDGVLLLLVKDERALRIEVGYGLEGSLTDASASRIIHDSMLPQLRKDDVHGAIQAGIGQIIPLIESESLPQRVKGWLARLLDELSVDLVILMLLIALMVSSTLGRRLPRLLCGLLCAMVSAGVFWLLASSLLLVQTAAVIGLIVGLLRSRDGSDSGVGSAGGADGADCGHSGSHRSADSGSSFDSSSSGDFGGGGASGSD